MRKLIRAGIACVSLAAVFTVMGPASAQADVVPTHAVNICQSATFYQNFDHATNAPVDPLYVLDYGRKVGHTIGAHPVYEGWAATFDFGDQTWGYMEYSCIGDYGSW
ncbi:hypothetical protein POF50_023390 [Streptomyces sp. SL13]|uniref:Uncharacterized protein n=1 Tax=Streptantibioticus silvisoli TaxID=2705255 RepID=A0AA90H1D0_9ACTN|nr:hypothetical protein [Streptantibioticus silvisoli]MDI5966675.1 hypothetical protein [Streptantibioticus silvisoli]MDI5972243.1 hypothetical protein [Streptantibioticus silvisoli]